MARESKEIRGKIDGREFFFFTKKDDCRVLCGLGHRGGRSSAGRGVGKTTTDSRPFPASTRRALYTGFGRFRFNDNVMTNIRTTVEELVRTAVCGFITRRRFFHEFQIRPRRVTCTAPSRRLRTFRPASTRKTTNVCLNNDKT